MERSTFHLLRRAIDPDGTTDGPRDEIQRVLHGLGAITRLHVAQEDEIYGLHATTRSYSGPVTVTCSKLAVASDPSR
jgi:hypothetical protein